MIDNTLVITNPLLGHQASNQQGIVTLTAGYHILVAQFVHTTGQAVLHIGWRPPGGTTWAAIPSENLVHDRRQEQAAGLSER